MWEIMDRESDERNSKRNYNKKAERERELIIRKYSENWRKNIVRENSESK